MAGPVGPRGATWFTTTTVPDSAAPAGAAVGDYDLDTATGTYYRLESGGWTALGNLIGPTGPTGPGYDFVMVAGATGPIPSFGTSYWVDVQPFINNANTGPMIGSCFVGAPDAFGAPLVSYGGAFDLPGGSAGSFSFSGIMTMPSASQLSTGDVLAPLMLSCITDTGNVVAPTAVLWWMSPVQVKP